MKSDRDASIRRLLEQTMRATSRSDDAGCLDAETLASWADGGLTGSGRDRAESHLAGCARCQQAIALMARSAPPVPVAEPWWRRHFGLGWLVPLTAAGAAVVLYVAVPRPERAPAGSAPVLESARAQDERAMEPSTTPAESRPTNEAREENRGQALPPAPVAPRPSQAVGRELDQVGKRVEAKAEQSANQALPGRQDSGVIAGQLADASRPTPAPPAAPQAASPPPAAAEAAIPASPPGGIAGSVSARIGPPGFAPEPGAVRSISTPDPRVIWRFSGGGTVERTLDRGTSWEHVRTGAGEELIAGAAPSATVCWIVGRRGLVLRTTDGRTWERVLFPSSVDLIGIQAGDARSARVTTADGRTLATNDGGATWN